MHSRLFVAACVHQSKVGPPAGSCVSHSHRGCGGWRGCRGCRGWACRFRCGSSHRSHGCDDSRIHSIPEDSGHGHAVPGRVEHRLQPGHSPSVQQPLAPAPLLIEQAPVVLPPASPLHVLLHVPPRLQQEVAERVRGQPCSRAQELVPSVGGRHVLPNEVDAVQGVRDGSHHLLVEGGLQAQPRSDVHVLRSAPGRQLGQVHSPQEGGAHPAPQVLSGQSHHGPACVQSVCRGLGAVEGEGVQHDICDLQQASELLGGHSVQHVQTRGERAQGSLQPSVVEARPARPPSARHRQVSPRHPVQNVPEHQVVQGVDLEHALRQYVHKPVLLQAKGGAGIVLGGRHQLVHLHLDQVCEHRRPAVPDALPLQQHHLLRVWLVSERHAGAEWVLHEVRGDEVVHLPGPRGEGVAPEGHLYGCDACVCQEVRHGLAHGVCDHQHVQAQGRERLQRVAVGEGNHHQVVGRLGHGGRQRLVF
mmetsp:Transcript_1260/g.2869  ORF Transcript_1260/g.2869 Transcript_1260/m.2869 type:complete len:474 (+) Transcript_1260:1163-2584(+)